MSHTLLGLLFIVEGQGARRPHGDCGWSVQSTMAYDFKFNILLQIIHLLIIVNVIESLCRIKQKLGLLLAVEGQGGKEAHRDCRWSMKETMTHDFIFYISLQILGLTLVISDNRSPYGTKPQLVLLLMVKGQGAKGPTQPWDG